MDFLYGFATENLIRKPFLIVGGVKIPGIVGKFLILSDFKELSYCGFVDLVAQSYSTGHLYWFVGMFSHTVILF